MLPLLTLFALPAALAASDPTGFTLGWKVPCAAAPEVSELVGAASGAAGVEVAPEGVKWRLVVRFLSPVEGERVMRTGTCEEAAQAALLIVRLGARGQPAVPAREPLLPPADPPPSLAVEDRPEPPRFSLAVTALAQQGTLPTLVSRFGVTAGLEWAERWMGLFSLRGGGQTVVPGGPTPESRVVVQPLIGGQISACWQPHGGRVSGGPCAVVGAEAWQVEGVNVARPRGASGISAVAGLDARGAVQLWEGLSVTATLGGRVGLVRPSVYFEDSGTVFQSGALSAEGELGLRWAW